MQIVFLLRHGETAWNEERRVMGRREIPLNRRGKLQAKSLARLMPQLKLDAIYSSPLRRARETTEILARGRRIPVEIDTDLTEVAFGRWEGLVAGKLIQDRVYLRFVKAPADTRMPGGETMRGVQRRGLRALGRAQQEYPQGRLLLVSHADVIRSILCHYLKLPLGELRRLRIDNGGLSALETDGTWAEVKFINYLPDIAATSRKPYEGLQPPLRRGERKA